MNPSHKLEWFIWKDFEIMVMIKFPIEELYRRVAKIDVLRNDTDSVVKQGSGFFYWYNDTVFFVTKRNYLIMEERAFLPDSLVLYPNIEAKAAELDGITLQLYDKNEKPVWRLLPTQTLEQYVSIPIKNGTSGMDFTNYFVSTSMFPKNVLLPMAEITLQIPVATCVSMANYFFYSHDGIEHKFRKEIEDDYRFSINRRGFAQDMLEMVLLLMEKNMFVIKSNEANPEWDELPNHLRIHQSLIAELEKIINQFNDVLEPSAFERVKNVFNIVKSENFMLDYFVVTALINRILMQLGNIAHLQ
jgi:hypothetical protein